MEKLSGLTLHNGDKVYTQEYIQFLRDADRKSPDKLKIIAQKGAQERILSVDADIKIVGGSRGGPLEKNTIVLTKNGKKAIKDIEYGDIVFGVNRKIKIADETSRIMVERLERRRCRKRRLRTPVKSPVF